LIGQTFFINKKISEMMKKIFSKQNLKLKNFYSKEITKLKAVLILSSTRNNSMGGRVLKYFEKKMNETNKFEIKVLDPKEINLPLLEKRKTFKKIKN
jgi:hypothetical protein